MILNGKEFGKNDLAMLLEAVKQVLTAAEHDICDANSALLDTSIHIGLVTENECNLG